MDSPTSSSASSSSRPPTPPLYPPPPLHARDISFDDDSLARPGPSRSPRPHSLVSQPTPPSAAYALAAATAGTSYTSQTSVLAGSLSRKSSARSRGKGSAAAGRFWFGGGGGTRSGSATEDETSERDYVPPPEDDVKETPTLLKTKDEATGKSLVNQYLILDELGRGQHGKVRLAMDVHDGSYWAIKIINRKAKKKLAAFSSAGGSAGRAESAQLQKENKLKKEIAILKKLRHAHVVRLREVIDAPSSKYIFLVFEYMEGGEVKWRTADERPILSVEETRRTFRDIVLGLEYLHHQGIIHRDIKPANLLWSADHATVKITDFGVSHHSKFLEQAAAEADSNGAHNDDETGASTGLDTPVDGSGSLSRVVSAAPSRAGAERYDGEDEVELAKTAGSPAFFAPELCYGGDTTPVAPSTPLGSPAPTSSTGMPSDDPSSASASFFARFSQARPGLAAHRSVSASAASMMRPPSRPHSTASNSHIGGSTSGSGTPSSSLNKRPRITKAIDVWALGVTLYCLLFARVPFEARSEFALFGVIPFDDYKVPPRAGSDAMPTGGRAWDAGEEARELGDLMDRLLEKDPEKRIKLEEVKRHPWVLRGIDNVHDWLARTDPTNDTFVTVTRDEVARALTETFSAKIKRTASRIKQKLFHSSSSSSVRSRADSLSPRSSGAQSGMLSSKHSFLHALRSGNKDRAAAAAAASEREHGGQLPLPAAFANLHAASTAVGGPQPSLSRSASITSSLASGSAANSRRHSRVFAPQPQLFSLSSAGEGLGDPVRTLSHLDLGDDRLAGTPTDLDGWRLDAARGWTMESHASAGSGSTARELAAPPSHQSPAATAAAGSSTTSSPASRHDPTFLSPVAARPSSPQPALAIPASSSPRARSPLGSRPPSLVPRRPTPAAAERDAYEDADEDGALGDGDDEDDDEGLALEFGRNRRRQQQQFLSVPPSA